MEGYIAAYSSEVLKLIRSNLEEELPDGIMYNMGNITTVTSHSGESFSPNFPSMGIAIILDKDSLPDLLGKEGVSKADALKALKERYAERGNYGVFLHSSDGSNNEELIENIRKFFIDN